MIIAVVMNVQSHEGTWTILGFNDNGIVGLHYWTPESLNFQASLRNCVNWFISFLIVLYFITYFQFWIPRITTSVHKNCALADDWLKNLAPYFQPIKSNARNQWKVLPCLARLHTLALCYDWLGILCFMNRLKNSDTTIWKFRGGHENSRKP